MVNPRSDLENLNEKFCMDEDLNRAGMKTGMPSPAPPHPTPPREHLNYENVNNHVFTTLFFSVFCRMEFSFHMRTCSTMRVLLFE